MKHTKHPKSRKATIEHKWEVYLNPATMKILRSTAKKNKVTISWIVRFCVFKLAGKRTIAIKHIREMADDLKVEYKSLQTDGVKLHRFPVCLYGKDDILLRELGITLKMSISMILRIAVMRYLPSLEKNKIPYWRLFWHGIKFCRIIHIFSSLKSGRKIMNFHAQRAFRLEDFWKIPEGPIPLFIKA